MFSKVSRERKIVFLGPNINMNSKKGGKWKLGSVQVGLPANFRSLNLPFWLRVTLRHPKNRIFAVNILLQDKKNLTSSPGCDLIRHA